MPAGKIVKEKEAVFDVNGFRVNFGNGVGVTVEGENCTNIKHNSIGFNSYANVTIIFYTSKKIVTFLHYKPKKICSPDSWPEIQTGPGPRTAETRPGGSRRQLAKVK